MRNLISLHTPREINQFVFDIWQTDIFRASHQDPYGYINHWVSRFAGAPRLYFEMSKPHIEHSHFTPWYNAIHFRHYDNPAIHDLFHFHEMVHITTLTYNPHLTFEAWADKMVANEQRTALESEVMIYHELPGLRALSFDFEIWADRFLSKPMLSRAEIFARRQRATLSPSDSVEHSLAHYPTQNQAWAEIWRANWRTVEEQMSRFYCRQETDREIALAELRDWLTTATGVTQDRPYSFPDEAEAFAHIYHRNKKQSLNIQELSLA